MKLKDKTILITGATSGFGKDMAIRAAKDGATIILVSRNMEKLQSIANEIETLGGKAIISQCDVRNTVEIKQAFLKATENGRVLDAVYNNAGLGHIANIWELTAEQIKEIIDVNVLGMIMVAKYASEVMVRQKHGHIVFSSSLAGLITLPQWSVYVASKWAITGFADSIRPELKPYNVRVTTLHPGAVKTEFFDKEKADIDISALGSAIDVSEVTNAVYNALFTNKTKLVIPGSSKMYSTLYRYMPGVVQKMIEKMAKNAKYHEITEEDEPEFTYITPYTDNEE